MGDERLADTPCSLPGLARFLAGIRPADAAASRLAEAHWDGIGKPLKGLGEMERLLERMAGIAETPDLSLQKRRIVAFCADNGIVEEGVTQTGDEVTAIVAENMARGQASVNLMAHAAGADVLTVDIGMRHPSAHPEMRQCAVARGTKNFTKTSAMSPEECLQAIATGISLAKELRDTGIQIAGVGEMGIGNTTTTGALTAALLGVDAELVSGRGAGLSDEGLRKKRDVIRRGLELHGLDHGPGKTDTEPFSFHALYAVGGFDIAGMVGFFFGCAAYRLPVVLDGAITLAAALCASELEKELTGRSVSHVADALIPSHLGREPVCRMICDQLKLHPVIHADLALGEGTGAALLFSMLDPVLAVYRENRTFGDIHVEAYRRYPDEPAGEKIC